MKRFMKNVNTTGISEIIIERFDDAVHLMTNNALVFGGAVRDSLANLDVAGDLDIVVSAREFRKAENILNGSVRWTRIEDAKAIEDDSSKEPKSVDNDIDDENEEIVEMLEPSSPVTVHSTSNKYRDYSIRQQIQLYNFSGDLKPNKDSNNVNSDYKHSNIISSAITFKSIDGRKLHLVRSKLDANDHLESVLDVVRKVDILCCSMVMDRDGNVYEVLEGAYRDCIDRVLRINYVDQYTDLNVLKSRIDKLEKRGWRSKINIKSVSRKIERSKEAQKKKVEIEIKIHKEIAAKKSKLIGKKGRKLNFIIHRDSGQTNGRGFSTYKFSVDKSIILMYNSSKVFYDSLEGMCRKLDIQLGVTDGEQVVVFETRTSLQAKAIASTINDWYRKRPSSNTELKDLTDLVGYVNGENKLPPLPDLLGPDSTRNRMYKSFSIDTLEDTENNTTQGNNTISTTISTPGNNIRVNFRMSEVLSEQLEHVNDHHIDTEQIFIGESALRKLESNLRRNISRKVDTVLSGGNIIKCIPSGNPGTVNLCLYIRNMKTYTKDAVTIINIIETRVNTNGLASVLNTYVDARGTRYINIQVKRGGTESGGMLGGVSSHVTPSTYRIKPRKKKGNKKQMLKSVSSTYGEDE